MILYGISTFSNHPALKSLQIVSCFILGVEVFHRMPSLFFKFMIYLLQSYKFFLFWCFIVREWVPNVLNVLLFRSIQQILQATAWTPTPIPVFSDFVKFGFDPEKCEKRYQLSTIIFIEKDPVSSICWVKVAMVPDFLMKPLPMR